jgi:hypothetical protein
MLVEASDLFTPADIEFAARKGSQRALGLAIYGELDTQPRVGGPTTDGYLAALSETRPTLTQVIVEEFTEDIRPSHACSRSRNGQRGAQGLSPGPIASPRRGWVRVTTARQASVLCLSCGTRSSDRRR